MSNFSAYGLIAEPTKLNVSFVFEPRVVIAAMQTTMIRASMTAYSTAVGPSSRFRKFTTFLTVLRIGENLRGLQGHGGHLGVGRPPGTVPRRRVFTTRPCSGPRWR